MTTIFDNYSLYLIVSVYGECWSRKSEILFIEIKIYHRFGWITINIRYANESVLRLT